MKRLCITLLVAFLATLAFGQKNNLFWTMRVTVKMDKKLDWEKKAPVFMKTHYPQYKFRVWEIMTGDNSGSYVIAIGPITYADFDKPPVFPKGEALVKTEGQMLDALSESTMVTHHRRDDGISSMSADRKLKFTAMTYVECKIGKWQEIRDFFMKIKEAREKAGRKDEIDFFRPLDSGTVNAFAYVSYHDTLAQLDEEYDFEEMYNKTHGANSWYIAYNAYLNNLLTIKRELRAYRGDLSTPGATNLAAATN
jgi:hypothetical protein